MIFLLNIKEELIINNIKRYCKMMMSISETRKPWAATWSGFGEFWKDIFS